MAMTITEKILARAAGREAVHAGENVWVDVDVLLTHDVCGPGTFGVFYEHFGREAKVWDPNKVVIIPDHYIFTADEKARRNVEILRKFVAEQGIPHYYDVGTDRYKGVCHVALAEEGHTRPGEVLFGTDSHTCTAGAFAEFATGIGNTEAGFVLGTGRLWVKVPETMRFVFQGEMPPYLMAKDLILHVIGEIGVDGATYRAMEFAGDVVHSLNMDERMTLCNMAVEAGAKNGIIAADEVTLKAVRANPDKPFLIATNDPGARFHSERVYNVAHIEPTVAKPHSPGNRALARELSHVSLDRVYIGSCTGGKLTDFVAAARVLKGRTVKVETFIVPATTRVLHALQTERVEGETLAEIFQAAGCQMGPASCAACLGGPPDTFGRLNEPLRCVSTTNRNFPGRMGHPGGQVFLASPLTAAASAVMGRVADPRELLA